MFMIVRISLSVMGGIFGLLLAVILGMATYLVLALPLTTKYFKVVANKLFKKQVKENLKAD